MVVGELKRKENLTAYLLSYRGVERHKFRSINNLIQSIYSVCFGIQESNSTRIVNLDATKLIQNNDILPGTYPRQILLFHLLRLFHLPLFHLDL